MKKLAENGSRRQGTAAWRAKTDGSRRTSEAPVYLRIARELKQGILDGRYPVGSNLPKENQLAKDYDVSRNTIRESLRKLREEKLVASRRGSGTRVLPPQPTESNFLHAISINDFQSYAKSWSFDIQVLELRKLEPCFASWTGVSPEEDWLAVQGVSRTHGATFPECWVEIYVHKDFAAIGRLVATHPGPVFKLIEDMFGQKIVELTQEISADLVPKKLARVLDVSAGSPAIIVRRAFKTADGKVVEAALETYPASRFRYQVNLHRADAKQGM